MMNRRNALRRLGLGMAGMLGAGSLRGQVSPVGGASATGAVVERFPELRLINLAGNENPFGPSVRVTMALSQQLSNSCRYPFREEKILLEDIARLEGVSDTEVILGNGCDEILSMIAAGCVQTGATVVATRPTYLQLMDYAEKRGAHIRWVDHDVKTMQHDLAAMEAAIDSTTALVYICNPDTPTGTRLDSAELAAFCRRVSKRCLVVVDEVYLDLLDTFAEDSMVPLLREGHELIVTRSFSKLHALAGHRIGYAVGPAERIKQMGETRMSSLNFLGVAAARSSLQDHTFHSLSRRRIREGRDRLYTLLDDLKLRYIPSSGNFVFHHTGIPNEAYQAHMREKGILVGRNFPPYADWNRISIGTEAEMRTFSEALMNLLKGQP